DLCQTPARAPFGRCARPPRRPGVTLIVDDRPLVVVMGDDVAFAAAKRVLRAAGVRLVHGWSGPSADAPVVRTGSIRERAEADVQGLISLRHTALSTDSCLEDRVRGGAYGLPLFVSAGLLVGPDVAARVVLSSDAPLVDAVH